jgi:hypothetical protein
MPENAGCLAFIDCDYQINIIEDSLRQSQIFGFYFLQGVRQPSSIWDPEAKPQDVGLPDLS